MKPTRNIVTPIKGLWNSKRRVWYQHNDDSKRLREFKIRAELDGQEFDTTRFSKRDISMEEADREMRQTAGYTESKNKQLRIKSVEEEEKEKEIII